MTIKVNQHLGKTLGKITAEFYHFAALHSTREFVNEVLIQFNQLIHVDCAIWFTYQQSPNCSSKPTIYTYQVSNNLAQQVSAALNIDSTLANPDTNDEQIQQNLARSGFVNHTVYTSKFNQKVHILVLLNSEQQHQLIKNQKQIIKFLLANATRAFEQHLNLKLQKPWLHKKSIKAICDLHGNILTSDSNFQVFIKQHFNGNLANLIESDKQKPTSLYEGKYKFHMQIEANLCLIELYEYDDYIEQLTNAEKFVALGIIKGLTAHQIAESKNVSFKTVNNQINSLYNKLQVANNAELTSYLLTSNYCYFCE